MVANDEHHDTGSLVDDAGCPGGKAQSGTYDPSRNAPFCADAGTLIWRQTKRDPFVFSLFVCCTLAVWLDCEGL